MDSLTERLRKNADWLGCNYDDICDDMRQSADRIEKLEAALGGLIDDEPCWYDHHGYCQAHFVTSPCEMAIARTTLSP